jgi:hypothetical protein
MKVKVRILDSIAGLADPRPKDELDAKYATKIEKMNAGREKPFSKHFTDTMIGQMKSRDRYGEKPIGFPRDWSFKPGDEPMIDADLAVKWEDSGICMVITEKASKAA